MKLPAKSVISRDKLTGYLLVHKSRADKSAYLAKAGYTQANPEQLENDLRSQMLPLDAVLQEDNQFGRLYEIAGNLQGPNHVVIPVRTIWMTEHWSGITKLITLIPDTNKR